MIYPGVTRNANVIQVKSAYHAKNPLLFSKMPAQPMTLVKSPNDAATVERMSSLVFATRMMSAWVKASNQVSRQKTSATRE